MNPALVHRYSFPVREAIEALLGDSVGDAQSWQLRVDGEELVVDIVGPAEGVRFEKAAFQASTHAKPSKINAPEGDSGSDSPASNLEAKSNAPAPPERKGGPLAQRAAMACGERGFWTFLGKAYGARVASADDAAIWLRKHCGIATRADLDHEPAAAAKWQEVSRRYGLWLEGYD